jgi:hypothetical protein
MKILSIPVIPVEKIDEKQLPPQPEADPNELVVEASAVPEFGLNSELAHAWKKSPYASFLFRAYSLIDFGNGVQFNLIKGAHSSNVYIATSGSITFGQGVRAVGNFISEISFIDFGVTSRLLGRSLMPTNNISFFGGNNVTLVPNVLNPTC